MVNFLLIVVKLYIWLGSSMWVMILNDKIVISVSKDNDMCQDKLILIFIKI